MTINDKSNTNMYEIESLNILVSSNFSLTRTKQNYFPRNKSVSHYNVQHCFLSQTKQESAVGTSVSCIWLRILNIPGDPGGNVLFASCGSETINENVLRFHNEIQNSSNPSKLVPYGTALASKWWHVF